MIWDIRNSKIKLTYTVCEKAIEREVSATYFFSLACLNASRIVYHVATDIYGCVSFGIKRTNNRTLGWWFSKANQP